MDQSERGGGWDCLGGIGLTARRDLKGFSKNTLRMPNRTMFKTVLV
jgi:hypothetical protein